MPSASETIAISATLGDFDRVRIANRRFAGNRIHTAYERGKRIVPTRCLRDLQRVPQPNEGQRDRSAVYPAPGCANPWLRIEGRCSPADALEGAAVRDRCDRLRTCPAGRAHLPRSAW